MNFLSSKVRPLWKSMKWTTCSESVLFGEYYFKLHINVSKIIADSVFYIHSRTLVFYGKNNKDSKFSNLLIQNFSSWQKCLGLVGLWQKKLFEMALFWQKKSISKFQIYFCSLNMNYNSSLLLEIIWLATMYVHKFTSFEK